MFEHSHGIIIIIIADILPSREAVERSKHTLRPYVLTFNKLQLAITLLYSVECHNTVLGSKRSAICAKAVYFLHSTMPSVTYLRLSDIRVICRVTYFQFPIQVSFSFMSIRQDTQRRIGLPSIGHRTRHTVQRNDFELILMVKMET